MADLTAEATRIEEWRALQREHQEAISAFLDARSSVLRLLRDRRKRLEPLIEAGLQDAGIDVGWHSHNGSGLEVWNAYHFSDADWSVELKMSVDPATPDIFIYHYPGRSYENKHVETLGVSWIASDQDIADAFLERTKQILNGSSGELSSSAGPS